MKVFHQIGFRHNWNIESFQKNVGDGLIFSPINLEAEKLIQLSNNLKRTGFLDPQLYLLNEGKGKLDTYPFFPLNLTPDFATANLENENEQLAKECVDFQHRNDFGYLIIPTRYYVDNPTSYFQQSTEYFVAPFCKYIQQKGISKKVLLSVIVKNIMLTDDVKRSEVLNWLTSHIGIDGIYLIFENNFPNKQIKDFDFLLNAVRFIWTLKESGLEVHLGYTNTEAILYSIAMPDSVTVGSYENLRSFAIKRFKDEEKTPMRPPNARLYSSKLLQWIDYQYIEAMKRLLPDYDGFFDESEFKPLMFQPTFQWHFAKAEPYKHYFYTFNNQVKRLPEHQSERIESVKNQILNSISLFQQIEQRVLLDSDSNGSHLPTWHNVINAFSNEVG